MKTKNFSIVHNNPDVTYLDSAATSLTPDVVIDSVVEYYKKYRSTVHRGTYSLAIEATDKHEGVRRKVASFIHASSEKEIVFTSGTTHSINLLAYGLSSEVKKGDNIVVTRLEHHANLLPWQRLAKETGAELRFVELTDDFQVNFDDATQKIDDKTKIVATTYVSNVTGTIVPVAELCALAKKVEAITVVDAAQAASHVEIDVQALGCDALTFSAHKMYGPTGIGVLWAKKDLLERMEPYHIGGGMVDSVKDYSATWANIPYKFEAGTPNVAGVVGFGAAVDFFMDQRDSIFAQEKELAVYAIEQLEQVKNLDILGPKINQAPVVSFTIDGINPYDLASTLGEQGIAVRAGEHCAAPLIKTLGVPGTCRISPGMYNDESDIDRLIGGIKKSVNLLKV